MTAPQVIGAYVRQAGVWERANAGTPEGFSGPQVRQAGVWENALNVRTYVPSVWQFCWTNIDGEINIHDIMAQDFDISPYSVTAGFKFLGTGEIQRNNNGSGFVDWINWWQFNVGRNYEIWFEYDSGQVVTSEPTLNTWLNLTDPDTDTLHGDSKSGTGFLNWNSYYTVRLREKVSAPAGGNDLAELHILLEAEV